MKLAVTIAVLGLLCFFAILSALYVAPATTFAFIDEINSKLLFLVFISVFIFLIGIGLYSLLHLPSARMLVYRAFLFLLAMAFLSSSFSVFGMPKVVALTFQADGEFNADFDWTDITATTGPILVISISALLIILIIYCFLRYFDEKHGLKL